MAETRVKQQVVVLRVTVAYEQYAPDPADWDWDGMLGATCEVLAEGPVDVFVADVEVNDRPVSVLPNVTAPKVAPEWDDPEPHRP